MAFVFNDGGRLEAGFKGQTNDCVCRSVAIISGKPYREVYDELNEFGKLERTGKKKRSRSSARTGVHPRTIRAYLELLGFEWTPTMQIGSGCKVHLRADELPNGKLIVNCSRHITAVIDGVVHDTHDPSRDGTRCVYGYWTPPRNCATLSTRLIGHNGQPPNPERAHGLMGAAHTSKQWRVR